MEETWTTLEQATQALANTADRAAKLIRQEAERARAEAIRTRGEIESVKTEVRIVQGELETVRKTLVSATADTDRARTGAAIAWRCVGAMAIAVVIAVGWTSARLSRSSIEIANTTARLQDWRTMTELAKAEIVKLRSEVESARVAQARAEAQVASMTVATLPAIGESSPGPTTRPTLMTLISGFADALRGTPTEPLSSRALAATTGD